MEPQIAPFDTEPAPDEEDEILEVDEHESDPDETIDFEELAEILAKYPFSPKKEEDELYAEILAREEEYFEFLLQIGMLQMWRVANSAYYGMNGVCGEFETQSIRFSGDDSESVEYLVNEFRSFCDQIFNMTTRNRPAFQAQAINTDVPSLAQIEASDNVIKYYYEQIFGERKEKEVVKAEGLYGKAYTVLDWDENAGPDVEVDEPVEDDPQFGPQEPVKKMVKAGKFSIKRFFPWRVISDPYISEHDEHLWRVTMEPRVKMEMIAKYPLYARAIDQQAENQECAHAYMFPGPIMRLGRGVMSDQVMVRTLYHAPCAVLPEGRKAVFVGSKLVDDGPLPIEIIPVFDYMSCELDGTNVGISDLWNLIPEQQMNNQILSDIATNVEAFGRPPLVVLEGSDLDIDAMANGQKVMTVPSMEQMPQVIEYPQVGEISVKLVDLNRKFMQALSGLNAIARGDSDASVQSGTHAALYHAMAVENQSPRQANLDLHRERTTNAILMFLKKYAKHPQLVAIAGVDERPNMQYFNMKDVEGVHRVVIKTANPLMRTQAGRLQIAELLRDWPGQPLKDPAQIVELIVSGQMKPLYNPTRIDEMRIRYENEILANGPPVAEVPSGEIDPMTGQPALDPMTGQPKMKKTVPSVPVLATDNPALHIIGVLEVLSQPDTLKNPAKMDACLTHIAEHLAMGREGDPYLASLLGHPPPAQMMQPGGAPAESASGAEGPSDKDLEGAINATQKPGSEPSMEETDDSKGALGRVPKPAQPPKGMSASAVTPT